MATAGTRATDDDRNHTCQALDAALDDGQLTMEEHRQRVSAATSAITLGDLQSLLSDLQVHQPARLTSSSTGQAGSWGIRIAVVGVLVLLGLGIGWGLSDHTSSAPQSGIGTGALVPTSAAGTATTQLQSIGGLTDLLTHIREKFGDTQGYQLIVYPDYAVHYRADPRNQHRALGYDYRNGGFTAFPAGMIPADTAVADLSKFGIAPVVGALRDAPQTLKIGDVKSTYLIINGRADASLDLSVYVSDTANNSGYIQLGPDATVKAIYPPDY